jgi:hypothetical protein
MTNGAKASADAIAATTTEAGPEDGASGAAATTTSSAKEIEVSSKFYGVQFRVHVSMRYHQSRRAWWTNLNRISSAAGALAGSAALVAVFGKSHPENWAYVSAVAGTVAALNAAFGFADRAREHADLYRNFSSIAARMATATRSDDAAGAEFEAEVLQVEASEPPSIHTLNVICHNQECEARGLPQENRCKVYLVNRVFKSWFTVYDKFPSLPPASET